MRGRLLWAFVGVFAFGAPSGTNRRFVENGTRYVSSTNEGETSYSKQSVDGSVIERHHSVDRVETLGGPEALGGILTFVTYRPIGTGDVNGRNVVQFTASSANEDGVGDPAKDGDGARVLASTFDANTIGTVHVERPDWMDSRF